MSATPVTTERGHWREPEDMELSPILGAARDAFYEHGFHGTTVRDIAKRVGVTVPALYYHFENKEDLLLTLLRMATEDIAWRVDAAVDEAGDDPVQALSNVAEAVVLHMTIRTKLAALDAEARYLSPENRDYYAAPRNRIELRLADVLRRGVETGVFTTTEPREAARALLGMWQFISRWFREDGTLTPQELTVTYIGLSLATVGAR